MGLPVGFVRYISATLTDGGTGPLPKQVIQRMSFHCPMEKDMHIGCTQMHPFTLVAIIIELVIFGAQAALYLQRPQDGTRLWFIELLVLVILLNFFNGLFPDPGYAIPLFMQHNIVTAMGIVVVSYFPLYFYRGFGLERLRFHARYGIALFLLLPYFVFFIVAHAVTEDTDLARRYGFIVPMGYAVVLLLAVADAIHSEYRRKRDKDR